MRLEGEVYNECIKNTQALLGEGGGWGLVCLAPVVCVGADTWPM